MKIYNKNTGAVIYDSQPGASDAADPTTAVGTGSSITITGGNVSTTTTTAPLTMARPRSTEELARDEALLQVQALPNPTSNHFTLVLKGSSNAAVNLRVLDVLGRVVEARSGVATNSTLRLGAAYRPGIYFVEVMQGTERITLKLVKQSAY